MAKKPEPFIGKAKTTREEFLQQARPQIIQMLQEGKSQQEIVNALKAQISESDFTPQGKVVTPQAREFKNLLDKIQTGLVNAPITLAQNVLDSITQRDAPVPESSAKPGVSTVAKEIPKTPEEIQAELEASALAASEGAVPDTFEGQQAAAFAQLRGLPLPTMEEIRREKLTLDPSIPSGPFLSAPSRSIWDSLLSTFSGRGAEYDFMPDDVKRQVQLEALAGLSIEVLSLAGGGPLRKQAASGATRLMTGTATKEIFGGFQKGAQTMWSFEGAVQSVFKTPMMKNLVATNPMVRRLYTFLGGELPEKIVRRTAEGAALAVPLGIFEAGLDEPRNAEIEGREAEPAKAFFEMVGSFALFEVALGTAAHLTQPFRQKIKESLQRTAGEFMRKRMEAILKGKLGPVTPEEMATVAEGAGQAAGESITESMEHEFLDNFRATLQSTILPILEKAGKDDTNPYVTAFWRGVMRGTGDENTVNTIEAMQSRFDMRLARRRVRGSAHFGELGRIAEADQKVSLLENSLKAVDEELVALNKAVKGELGPVAKAKQGEILAKEKALQAELKKAQANLAKAQRITKPKTKTVQGKTKGGKPQVVEPAKDDLAEATKLVDRVKELQQQIKAVQQQADEFKLTTKAGRDARAEAMLRKAQLQKDLAQAKRDAAKMRSELASRPTSEESILAADVASKGKKEAPVTFIGEQERPGGKPPIKLYNLTEEIPGHPKGSTVSAGTLEDLGYIIPDPNVGKPVGRGKTVGGRTRKGKTSGSTPPSSETILAEDEIGKLTGEIDNLQSEIDEIVAAGTMPAAKARTEIGRRKARIAALTRKKADAIHVAREGGSRLGEQMKSDANAAKRVTKKIESGKTAQEALAEEHAAIDNTRGATLAQLKTIALEEQALAMANQLNPEPGVVAKSALEGIAGADVKLRAREIVRARIRARGGPRTEAERVTFFPNTSRKDLIKQAAARAEARAEAARTKPTVANKEVESSVADDFIPPLDEPPAKTDALDDIFDALGDEDAFLDGFGSSIAEKAVDPVAKPLAARRIVRKRTTAPSLAEVREAAGAQGYRLRSLEEPQKLSDDTLTLHPFEEAVQKAQKEVADLSNAIQERRVVYEGVEGNGKIIKGLQNKMDQAQTRLDIYRKRNEERLGRGGRDSLRPNPKNTDSVRELVLEDSKGNKVAQFTSTRDALAWLKENAGGPPQFLAFSAEVAAQAIADDPEDTPEERQIKVGIRTALRLGTLGSILASSRARPRAVTRAWEAFKGGLSRFRERGFEDSFLQSPSFEKVKKQFQDLQTSFWTRIFLSMRGSEEMIRNWPDSYRIPMQQFFAAERQLTKAHEQVRQQLIDWKRLGVGDGSKASERVGALMDMIPSAILRVLPHDLKEANAEATKAIWRKHLANAIKVGETSEAQINLAMDAIENASGHELLVAKEMTNALIRLRDAELKATREKIASEIKVGFRDPIAIKDKEGHFIRRVKTVAQAERLINKAAKKGKEWDYSFADEATPEEVVKRVGPTLTTYLPRMIYESMRDRYNIDGLIAEAPWADPVIMLREFRKINQLHGKDKREAIEMAFGPNLTKEERNKLYRTISAAMAHSRAQTDRLTTLSVPREVYVQFYKNRIMKNQDYSRDAIKLYNSYASTVSRDIHMGPRLPSVVEGLQAARLKGENEAILDMLVRNIDFIMGRDAPFSVGAARAIGRLTGLAYGASLWGRVSPAFNNVIGQMWLVGFPEMGVDSAIAGLVAMASPTVRTALAERQMVWSALPLQERQLLDAFKALKNARTVQEAAGALKDSGVRALDFLGMSETFIRQWAFLGGLANELKSRGVLKGNFPGGPLTANTSIGQLQNFLKPGGIMDSLSKEEVEHIFLGAERNVGKVAFWFNPASQPLLMRKIKNVPGGGLVTMFMNFPVNYTNRFMSILADATSPVFGRRLPAGQVQAAWGKIIRHLTATYLVAGPAALPLVNEMMNEVSDLSPTMGAELRKRMEPYQNWWARYIAGSAFLTPGVLFDGDRGGDPGVNVPFTDVPIPGAANIFRDIDKTRFSTLTPLKDLASPVTDFFGLDKSSRTPSPPLSLIRETFQAGRGQLHRGSVALANGLFGTDIEIDPSVEEMIRKDEQKFFGFLSPYVDVPAPEGYQLPSVVNRLITGGGALQDFLNFAYANRAAREQLAGPLSPQHRARALENPLQRMFFSSTEQAARERRDSDALSAIEKQNKLIVDDFLNAMFNPLVGDKEKTRAQNRFIAHPELHDRGFSEQAAMATINEQHMTPIERKMASASMATLERVLPSLFERTDPERMAHMTAEERDRTLRMLMIALQRQREHDRREKKASPGRGKGPARRGGR